MTQKNNNSSLEARAGVGRNNRVLRWTSAHPGSYGGYHRTLQLEELIQSAGGEIIGIDPEKLVRNDKLRCYLHGLAYQVLHRPPGIQHHVDLRIRGWQRKIFLDAFRQYPDARFFLSEFVTAVNPKNCGRPADMPVLATPHNLESFYDRTPDGRLQGLLDNLRRELVTLEEARHIFCISAEERWLLGLFDIEADLLPYHPPRPVESRMRAIRERRAKGPKKGFLILGSAFNPDTAAGMRSLVEWFQSFPSIAVNVAGNYTDKIGLAFTSSQVTFHGEVDIAKLDDLLAETCGVVIFQKAGTGMLTRIPELLTAGVPIIANAVSARSCQHLDGLLTYESFDELEAHVKGALPTPPIPARPQAEEERFKDCVRRLLA